MLSRVLRTIAEHRLFAGGDRVLCAVSGGPDSMALVHALAHLAPRLGLYLEVASVDHGLRDAAAGEARVVVAAAERLGLVGTVLTVDVAAHRGPHVSLQDGARRARLGALEAHARARGLGAIALGHTADDQAETILFRVVRGTGIAGLAGIPYRRGIFVRPILDVRRAEVLAFLRRRRISFVDDPSNSDRRFARSRVRHDWIPLLARDNPRVVEALLGLGHAARAAPMTPDGVGLVDGDSGGRAPALGPRGARRLQSLVARGQGSQRLAVPGGVIDVAYGRAVYRPGAARSWRKAEAAEGELVVQGEGRLFWPPREIGTRVRDLGEGPERERFELNFVLRSGNQGPPADIPTFAPESLAAGLTVRGLRPGDRMRPRGFGRRRKLQDLLVDAKVERARRAGLPVVTAADGTILFVPGIRPAEDARPAPDACAWLEIRVRPWSTFRATIDPPAAARVDDE